ncbi:MAG: DUF4157 domain-containing protein [Bacteroidetes bacterium]|nr:DUF4157 domain-containing protein [Bacteroidota bacterium]
MQEYSEKEGRAINFHSSSLSFSRPGPVQRKKIALPPNHFQPDAAISATRDFPGVRMHLNSPRATELHALAFTQGNEIHFAPGQYDPDSPKGKELIGHELAHVRQQMPGKRSNLI